MKEIITLQVGDNFNLFDARNGLREGSYFEALEDKNGFFMLTYMHLMTEGEKKLLAEEKIQTRMIREGNKVMFLNRYGNSTLIFEVTFDPTLYNDKRAMQIAFDNHMVTFVGIELSNNKIQTLRMANFPLELKLTLITVWTSAFEEENYSENFTKWVNNLYRYDTWTLWENAIDVGHFGESGDSV